MFYLRRPGPLVRSLYEEALARVSLRFEIDLVEGSREIEGKIRWIVTRLEAKGDKWDMANRFAAFLILSLGVTGCSGQQLTRSSAQRILRENMASGQFGHEIADYAHVQVGWLEQMWQESGSNVERMKLYTQTDLSFLDHLVAAGVLQKLPDTPRAVGCSPQPACRDHNKWFNYSVVPSHDVRDINKGLFTGESNGESAYIVLARPAGATITGITQQGSDATVEFTYIYNPTPLYKQIVELTREDFAKCSLPELSSNPPFFCPMWGHWPSEADIAARKETGTLEFRKYDDGWRIVKPDQ